MPKPAICIFQTEAGEGHKNAERIIRKVMADKACFQSFEVYRDVFADQDLAAKYLGISSPDIYNRFVLQQGHSGLSWTVLAGLNLAYMKLMKNRLAARVAEFISQRRRRCDLAVTLAPLVGAALTEGVKRVNAHTPVLTVVTDFTEPVRGVWFQDPRQTVLVCTPKARDQALKAGIPEKRVHLLSGAPIDAQALSAEAVDTAPIRARLSGHRPVVLLLFGGHAGLVVEPYLKAIEASDVDADVICVCGRNESLRERLTGLALSKIKLITGFVDIAPYYAAADVVVGKPGPGVISEAAYMGTPLLLESNRKTMAQERFNAGWAKDRGIAETFAGHKDLADRLRHMLDHDTLACYRANSMRIQNNSMAEIRDIFSRYLAG